MSALGLATRERIKTIGLYRNKAKNVMALSRQLIVVHGGAVPRQREALEALPGVGRKTANVVLNIAFGESTLAVDTHVFRVAHRLKLAKGKTPLEVELGCCGVVPPEYLRHAHHWLILHGRYICQARKPRCDACIVCDLCSSQDKWFDCGGPPAQQEKGKPRHERQQRPRVPEYPGADQRSRRGAGCHAPPGHRHLFRAK